MSTAPIPEEIEPDSVDETAKLEHETPLELFRRFSSDVPDEDAALLDAVCGPMPHQSRWDELQKRRGEDDWNEELNAEMLCLNGDRESANVRRVAAAMRLSIMRGVAFDDLWKELVLSQRSC